MGTVSITEVVNMVTRYLEPPVPDGQEMLDNDYVASYRKAVEEELNKIIIIPYLPLADKILILSHILYDKEFLFQNNSLRRMIELEESKFWDGLMQYSNITIEEDEEEHITRETMDLIMLAIGKVFNLVCGEDYRVFCSMIDNALFLESVENLTNMLSTFDNDKLAENTAQIEELLNGLKGSKKLVSNLASIVAFNNPQLDKVLKGEGGKIDENNASNT